VPGPAPEPTPERPGPVARVVVDLPLAHLDRPFDYAVPDGMSATARPGVRVRVRFAGQDVDAFVVARLEGSDHEGPLTPLRRVVSPEPVLSPQVVRLARAVADRYAGTLPDVLRLAVPPRHAATEKAAGAGRAPGSVGGADGGIPRGQSRSSAWADYPAGAAFLGRLGRGEAPRAVWAALPGATHWAEAIAEACGVTIDAGRAAVVVLPDRRDVDVLEKALLDRLGPGRHARLEADRGPAERYRAFLACLRGEVPIAIGTRSAAFAPVADPGLVVIWDDGDDLHAEPRAPYAHAREVLAMRAEQCGAAMLLGGWTVTAEGARLVEAGWARAIQADRRRRQERWPRVSTAEALARAEETPARLPGAAWRAIQDGLRRGPVLVQVPRAGYLPGLGCGSCRRPARCPHCAGPVQLRDRTLGVPEASSGDAAGAAQPSCGWCGRALPGWTCPACGARALRARQVGVARTAEELGRAFPGAAVVLSRPERDLPRVPDGPTIVLATAGVEPPAPGGYAVAVLLDGDQLLARPDLRAEEEALRRWLAAAALVRPSGEGGAVVVAADPAAPAVQAMVRLDPLGFAERTLAERAHLGLPPARAAVTVQAECSAVDGLLGLARREKDWPITAGLLGPIPVPTPPGPADGKVLPVDEPRVRWVVRVPPADLPALARCLRTASAVRSARRERVPVRIQVDPRDLG